MKNADLMPARKPRLALMGEFSAGKSTLTNLLLGARPLPEKVTATRLAPVWISKGDHTPYREKIDGTTEPFELEKLDEIPIEDTRCLRLSFDAEVLDLCDIIDFPGISDPNMDAEVWERVIAEADIVLWCTHATQAWRQSEASVWETVPEEIRQRSMLLVTRFDKLVTEKDRARVLSRLHHETDGLFANVFPLSLLQAVNAKDDVVAWEESGAAIFFDELVTQLTKMSDGATASSETITRPIRREAPAAAAEEPMQLTPEQRVRPDPAPVADEKPLEEATQAPADLAPVSESSSPEGQIVPRRVVPRREGRPARPPRLA